MPLYPPSLIYLLLPLTWSLSFFCLLHLWFGGFGMYWLARKWTGNNFSGAFAGTAFAFSGMTSTQSADVAEPLRRRGAGCRGWSWPLKAPGARVVEKCLSQPFAQRCKCSQAVRRLSFLRGWCCWCYGWQQVIKNEFPRNKFWRFRFWFSWSPRCVQCNCFPSLTWWPTHRGNPVSADLRWSYARTHGWANYLLPMAFGHAQTEDIFFFQDGQYWTSSYYLGLGTLWLALLAVWKSRDRRVWLLTALAVFAAVVFALGGNTSRVFPAPRKSSATARFRYLSGQIFAAGDFYCTPASGFCFGAVTTAKYSKANSRPRFCFIFAAYGVIIFRRADRLASAAMTSSAALLLNGFSRAVCLIITGVMSFWRAHQNQSSLASPH